MRRFRVFVVVLLVTSFVISSPIRYGMAVTSIPYNTIVYGPLDIGGILGLPVVEGVGVCAHDKYSAAMTALGYGGDVVTGLDSDKKALLSNQSTGGAFWTFAQHFVNPSSNGTLTERMVYRYAELYGTTVVWSAEYQASEKASATDALEIILDGGTIGGGGGDDVVPEGYIAWTGGSREGNTFTLVGAQGNNEDDAVWNYGFYSSVSEMTDRVFVYSRTYSGTQQLYGYFVVPSGVSVLTGNNSPAMYLYNDNDSTVQVIVHYGPNYIGRPSDGVYKPVDLSRKTTVSINTKQYKFISNIDGVGYFSRAYYQGSSSPTIPPTNWPMEPETPAPTAPEVPEPSQPDLPSQPSQPTAPTLPDFPSNVIAPGTTYETFDIQAILDAMDEHCQHLQSAIYQGFADYFDTFTPWLRDEFSTLRTFLREEDDWIVESISDEFMELRSYLKELAEWLADQMDFTITGGDYDDSTVVSWLKKIYYKLGGASVNTKPVDPVGDPDGSWDWLKQLIDAILSALAGGAAALTGTLGELFEGIKDKFPFSIPWDIVAIVALLDAPPVTPAAVIEYDVFGAHVRYDIDLHFFDEQASVIRAMEDVLFCAFLLFKTDWLTGIFDGIGGFLGGKLKSTVKGA